MLCAASHSDMITSRCLFFFLSEFSPRLFHVKREREHGWLRCSKYSSENWVHGRPGTSGCYHVQVLIKRKKNPTWRWNLMWVVVRNEAHQRVRGPCSQPGPRPEPVFFVVVNVLVEVEDWDVSGFVCFFLGLVPEQKIQRETDEAAERPRGPAARLLQGSEENEAPGRQAGGSGHPGTWSVRLLRRWGAFPPAAISNWIRELLSQVQSTNTTGFKADLCSGTSLKRKNRFNRPTLSAVERHVRWKRMHSDRTLCKQS